MTISMYNFSTKAVDVIKLVWLSKYFESHGGCLVESTCWKKDETFHKLWHRRLKKGLGGFKHREMVREREKEDEVHIMIPPILDLYDDNDDDDETISEEPLLNIDIWLSIMTTIQL